MSETPLTDLGNAERFAQQHGDRVRYCASWRAWLVWDGRRWARDRDGEVCRLAGVTVRSIYAEAQRAATESERKALAAHAARSEAEPRIGAMVNLVKSLKPLASVPEAFDGPATTFLLNVENGTIDLKTGDLRPHRREDHITKLAPVVFDPNAHSARWDEFLRRQAPSPEVREMLQRAAGYTLTGSTGEEKLLFINGPEASGKSTFSEAIKATLGEYAATANFEAFLRKRGDNGPRDDIARLVGTRMVLSLEVDENRHLAEALVKNLTGGDTVTARHLYSSYFEYKPAFKLWLVANHQPKASAEDGALWRRILLVPFLNTVPEDQRDPVVKITLVQDPGARSAILAWAVEGCREWLKVGLGPPDSVRLATAAYRASCDNVDSFLSDCFPEPEKLLLPVTAKSLRESYEVWCRENGEKPESSRAMGAALKRRGFAPDREPKTGARRWRYRGQVSLEV